MPLSRLRREFKVAAGELQTPPDGDMQVYEVFVQINRERPPAYAGSVDAADMQMAVEFARDHFGRDQPCVGIWVAPRAAIVKVDDHQQVIWRRSDQSYRQAKGYYDVRTKWLKFRKAEDLASYSKEDLKHGF